MSRLRKSDRGIDSPEESEPDRKRGGEHDSHLMEPRGRMRFSGKGWESLYPGTLVIPYGKSRGFSHHT